MRKYPHRLLSLVGSSGNTRLLLLPLITYSVSLYLIWILETVFFSESLIPQKLNPQKDSDPQVTWSEQIGMFFP